MTEPVKLSVQRAIAARHHLVTSSFNTAFRVFNGFTEGDKQFVIEVFGRTVVINDYRDILTDDDVGKRPDALMAIVLDELPFVRTVVWKQRKSSDANLRNGVLLLGDKPDTRIVENGIQYALDITMNRDAGFYVDTRLLRQWTARNLCSKRVLNTFAYTGSIGIAAMTVGAKVVQTDLNRRFLNLAKQSCSINRLPIVKRDYIFGDFFLVVKQLQRQRELFDCVFLDPPFFSQTQRGRVDLEQNMTRLINKVRPLVASGGHIVAVNNALYVSGEEYMASLHKMCLDGCVSVEGTIDIPQDCIGYSDTIRNELPVSPAPFNHATKIAILNIRHR
ncbi:MAG: class I SAM-dependent methyltransferase [Deltaproteobacteria bacterium]|nr:class I SAM-dependent methyltransferase [Deltaproteobacteria bacterium]